MFGNSQRTCYISGVLWSSTWGSWLFSVYFCIYKYLHSYMFLGKSPKTIFNESLYQTNSEVLSATFPTYRKGSKMIPKIHSLFLCISWPWGFFLVRESRYQHWFLRYNIYIQDVSEWHSTLYGTFWFLHMFQNQICFSSKTHNYFRGSKCDALHLSMWFQGCSQPTGRSPPLETL